MTMTMAGGVGGGPGTWNIYIYIYILTYLSPTTAVSVREFLNRDFAFFLKLVT